MNLQLNWKHALVCGASKGLGKATAIELAKQGAFVTVAARSEDKLKDLVETLQEINGLENGYLIVDFSKVEETREKVKSMTNNKPIQVVINNSSGPAGGTILDAKQDDIIQAFTNHVLCNQAIAQEVIPNMKSLGYGRIINIISTSVRQPIKGIGISNTIRGAMASWAKTLSNELAADGITVNNVLPGATKTERLEEIFQSRMKLYNLTYEQAQQSMLEEVPMGRFGIPEEIASAIGFLASPAAAYITGVSLPVDGGKIKSI